MFTPADIIRFVFQCYNTKGRGMFGIQDFTNLTTDINTVLMGVGPRKWSDVLKYDNQHESIHQHSTGGVEDLPKKGYLVEEEFIKMVADYPTLICFATKLQTILQDLCLGERFYKKLLHRQERARAIEEYKDTHMGGLPKEEFSMNSWFRKVAYMASIGNDHSSPVHSYTPSYFHTTLRLTSPVHPTSCDCDAHSIPPRSAHSHIRHSYHSYTSSHIPPFPRPPPSVDDEPDLSKRDNSKLLELGFGLYVKLHGHNRIAHQ